MTKLTKAEREELRKIASDFAACETHIEDVLPGAGMLTTPAATALRAIPRLLADLDAAEAERDAHKELIDAARYDVGERSFLEDAQNILKECVAAYSCEQMQAVAKALRQWRDKWAILLETVVRTCEDRDDMMAQRDALKAKVDTERQRQNATLAKLREELGADLGCGGGLVEILTGIIGLREQRDALKAKLADPRRVVIHETEVVATKEEITSLKARLADLSEADEELHTCRALVNATSENLSVDLERMVDDLADANEKAARSEKDSHSWYELYEETKAKLAALANAAEVVAENYEDFAGFGELDCLAPLHAAIAAARGGAS